MVGHNITVFETLADLVSKPDDSAKVAIFTF
jgi:hypothetical protein